MYRVKTTETSQASKQTNEMSSNVTRVVKSYSVSRPTSKSDNLKKRVLHSSKDKSNSNKLKKEDNHFRIVSNKNVTSTSNVLKTKTNVLNAKDVNTECFSKAKRALFQSPLTAKSRSLGTTPVVAKSRFSLAMPHESKSSTSVVSNSKTPVPIQKCSKYMTGNLKLLKNIVEKFMGTVRFGNDHFVAITSYGDYEHENRTICHIYYVKGLGHNLFLVGQFCDGDLEVAFRSDTCFIQNLEGDDLLTGSCDFNLYTISISDMVASSPVCLMSKATSTKSWLWHRRLSHLNFGTINQLTKDDLVEGLLKFKYDKDHLCSACEQGKSKRETFKSKPVPSTNTRLDLLHMDLCRLMRVESINGKKYIMVIVDDYSRFTWVYFLCTKDEATDMIINFINQIQVNLRAIVRNIRTDNGTEFKNDKLKYHYAKLGITQQFSIARTPQQNGVVERRNRTLVEAARTMLIFSKAPEYLWAEAVITACFTQNRSLVHTRLTRLRPGTNCSNFHDSSEGSSQKPVKANLDDLFGPLYDEYYAGRNEEVSTNFAAPNTSKNLDTPSSSLIIVDNNEAPQIVSTSEEPTSLVTYDIADEPL
ncbi:retrovirus-related pol polyprotein from transposon TNT 1-94 [Tanacetum coccineum]